MLGQGLPQKASLSKVTIFHQNKEHFTQKQILFLEHKEHSGSPVVTEPLSLISKMH